MKTFGKLITLVLVGAISLVNTSCSKTETEVVTSIYYQFDGLEELKYITGNESTVAAFLTELNSVKEQYAGTSFNESDLISDINIVVSKYDNGVISGTFYLKKSTSGGESWSQVKSWTMKFGTN